MGYYMFITEHNLKYETTDEEKIGKFVEKGKFYLPLNYDRGDMDLEEYYFKWSSEFLKDLLALKNLGVRGFITCRGEEGEYLKYEINHQGVKKYCGSVVFPDKPDKVMKSECDIKKPEF